MTLIKGIVALALAAGAGLAKADAIYKYERPDGKVIYSDSPVEGARLVEKLEFPEAAAPEAPARSAPQPGASVDDFAQSRAAELDAADARIKSADRALVTALERQQQVSEPLPGERLGNAGGATSRLTPAYFARQHAAAAAVDAARSDLDEAYRLRNEARE